MVGIGHRFLSKIIRSQAHSNFTKNLRPRLLHFVQSVFRFPHAKQAVASLISTVQNENRLKNRRFTLAVEMVGIEPTCNNIFITVLQYIVCFGFRWKKLKANKIFFRRFSEFYEICRENSNFRILKILYPNKFIRNPFVGYQSLKGEFSLGSRES